MYIGGGIRLTGTQGGVSVEYDDGWWVDAPNNSFGFTGPGSVQYPTITRDSIVAGATYRISFDAVISGTNPQCRVRVGYNLTNAISILGNGSFNEVVVAGDENDMLRFIIDDNSTTSSLTITNYSFVRLTAPRISSVTIQGSAFLADSVLTAIPVGVSGVEAPTLSYQWQRLGIDIGGETASTYTRPRAFVGDELGCVVTATNYMGSDEATGIKAASPVNTAPNYEFYPQQNGENYVFYETAAVGYLGITDRSLGGEQIDYLGSFGDNYFNLRTTNNTKPAGIEFVDIDIGGNQSPWFQWNATNERYEGNWTGIKDYLESWANAWVPVLITSHAYGAPIVVQPIPDQDVEFGKVVRIDLTQYLSIPGDDPDWLSRTLLAVNDLGGGGSVFDETVFEPGVFW